MIVETNTLQLGGNGSDSPNALFLISDIAKLRDEYGATNGRLGNAIELFTDTNYKLVALFGLNSQGAEVGFAALPCPPYCGGDVGDRQGGGYTPFMLGTEKSKKKPKPIPSGPSRAFSQDVLTYLKTGTWPESPAKP